MYYTCKECICYECNNIYDHKRNACINCKNEYPFSIMICARDRDNIRYDSSDNVCNNSNEAYTTNEIKNWVEYNSRWYNGLNKINDE